jgi:hypothetical protein
MKKKFFVSIITLLLLLVLVVPAYAITHGEPDAGDHPYVGLILFPVEPPLYGVCSGTLISPTVVLTAGHCAALTPTAYVTFSEVYPGNIGGPDWYMGDTYVHPDFDDLQTFPNISDLGIILLEEPVIGIDPAEIADLGYLDSFKNKLGLQDTIFEPVGYGYQQKKPTAIWNLARYKGEQRIINLVNSLTDGYNVMLTNNPGLGNGSGGTCSGDSGGPILQGDIVVAVNSFGIAPHCKGNDFAYRVDITNAQDFIDDFIDLGD